MKSKQPSLKIVLLSPKGPLYRHPRGIFKKMLRAAPLTLTTLAALIPKELNATVEIYDEGIEHIPTSFEADLIGITVITGSSTRAYELADQYRQGGKTVVLGGPHVTLVPEESMLHADAIVTGYAEESWPELLHDFVAGRMKSRYDMKPDFSLGKSELLPFPRRELLKKKKFLTINTFEATRGCVHNCDFCVVPSAWGRQPFQKPISHVVEDIRQMGSKRIIFYDLNLIADRQYAKALFHALIPLKIKWFGLSTTLLLEDPELMDLIEKSGCSGLLIGFESIMPEGLGSIKKRFNRPQNYEELIYQLHQKGISIMGTFVFGLDNEEKDVFEKVLDFVNQNKIDLPRYAILTPFPGTPLFAQLEKQNRIITRDWSLYDGQHVVFHPNKLSADELLKGHEWVWRKTYQLPSIVRRVRFQMPNLTTILAANFGYRFYAFNLTKFYNCQGGLP
ncbi:MAG: radical SAM protein [Bacteroidia bacterium]|nr:radical SAM protein [Bacteroidia bacterium]